MHNQFLRTLKQAFLDDDHLKRFLKMVTANRVLRFGHLPADVCGKSRYLPIKWREEAVGDVRLCRNYIVVVSLLSNMAMSEGE